VIIDIVKTEPEVELENSQRTQFSDYILMDMLVYEYVRTRLSSGTYQKTRHA